mgnify:FL=1
MLPTENDGQHTIELYLKCSKMFLGGNMEEPDSKLVLVD